jgi:hypothetical protein
MFFHMWGTVNRDEWAYYPELDGEEFPIFEESLRFVSDMLIDPGSTTTRLYKYLMDEVKVILDKLVRISKSAACEHDCKPKETCEALVVHVRETADVLWLKKLHACFQELRDSELQAYSIALIDNTDLPLAIQDKFLILCEGCVCGIETNVNEAQRALNECVERIYHFYYSNCQM